MIIEIAHSGNNTHLRQCYNCDQGPLSMLESGIRIGGKDCFGDLITKYSEQVDEYAVWLEDQIKAENIEIMMELEGIFEMAQDPEGVVLCTTCCPDPWITHAHKIKQMIEEIAK